MRIVYWFLYFWHIKLVTFVQEKVQKNREKLENDVSQLLSSSVRTNDDSSSEHSGMGQMLSSRISSPLCFLTGPGQISGDDNSSSQEAAISISAKLPAADKIPPYTTWIFLARFFSARTLVIYFFLFMFWRSPLEYVASLVCLTIWSTKELCWSQKPLTKTKLVIYSQKKVKLKLNSKQNQSLQAPHRTTEGCLSKVVVICS